MRKQDFRSERAGSVEERHFRGATYLAFVPAPLPPVLTYDAAFVAALSEADATLGELSGVGRQLPNPYVLMTPYVRREAVLSSRIEGTRSSIADIFADEALHESTIDDDPDIQEVRNYVRALEFGISEVRNGRRIGLDLMLDLHRMLMTGVRGQDKSPGAFRTTQNWIGRIGSTPANATFVPPHDERVVPALLDWARFSEGDARAMPPLVACALMHPQFEAIHPFRDGNGRVGRLLIPLYLIERRRLPIPLLYLSAYLESRRAEYVQLLQAVSTDGDWEAWLRFFVEGISETAREGSERAAGVVAWYEQSRDAVDEHPHSLRLLRTLLSNPFISTTRAVKALDVTAPTARKALETLVERGVLTEAGKRGRTPLLVASRLLALLGEGTN
jgi:Fic family protein